MVNHCDNGQFSTDRCTHPVLSNPWRRTIHRLDKVNSVSRCAGFFTSPRSCTVSSPNGRLISRNGCPTLARSRAITRCHHVANPRRPVVLIAHTGDGLAAIEKPTLICCGCSRLQDSTDSSNGSGKTCCARF